MAKKKLLSGEGWSFEPAGGSGEKDAIESLPDSQQKARVKLEKRARGKEVTVVSGFVLSDVDRGAAARALRKACGAGGTDSEGVMEIQGNHCDRVREFFRARGWAVK